MKSFKRVLLVCCSWKKNRKKEEKAPDELPWHPHFLGNTPGRYRRRRYFHGDGGNINSNKRRRIRKTVLGINTQNL